MIDLNMTDHMNPLTGSNIKLSKNNISQKNFNSILLKNQISMLEAWNTKKSDSLTGINSGQLT